MKFYSIEWEAFDFDSGLNQVEWRLFDNYTSNFILHGKAELHAQGMAQVLLHLKILRKNITRKQMIS